MTDTDDNIPYTFDELINELDGWRRGGSMFPIEAAIAAVHWLGKAPAAMLLDDGSSNLPLPEVIEMLEEWLTNEEPNLPDELAMQTLYWLKRVKAHGG